MMSFYLSGGVEVLGFISPTEPTDEYPVIDPLYGIDGFRNVNTLSELNSIPNLRRRAGMVVGVSGGTQYYKLNPSPWNGSITDWSTFNSGSGGGMFTGGTVTGDTIFTQGVTATTISATTYQNLPLDVYTTGFTFNSSNYDISVELNDGTTLTQNLGILATDVTITGGTYDPLNGSITFVNNTGGTFTVTGFITGFTDIQVTGYTYQDNTFTISDSSGNTFSTTINSVTGLTVNGDFTVTGNTISNGLTATTISATTYQNLPLDVYVTGGTYSNGTIVFTNNSGDTFNVTGLYTGQTSYVNSLTTGFGLSADTTTGDITIINTDPDQIVTLSGGTGILTGGTYPNFTIENSLPDQTVVLNNGSNISVTGTYPNFTIDVTGLTDNDKYVTGFTYQDNTFTISDNSGSTFNATINTVTGLTINGNETINNGKLTINQNNGVVGVDVVNSTEAMVQVQNSPTEFSIFGRFTGETYIYSSLLVPIVFYTNGNNKRMVIDSIGNVGVGTTSPLTKLHVSGNTLINGSLTATTISATTYQNLPTDIRVTGASYNNNTFTFTNNTGGTFSTSFNTVTGLTINGNLVVTGNTNVRAVTGTTALFSGSGQNILTVVGSGNTTSSPLFTVQGSSGELFSVTDSLVGSLYSVNDISGLPILEVFSDNTILMGSYQAPSLNTTARVIATTGTTNVYSIPTSAYTGAFFDYTVSDGTNLRAGNIMSIWSGSSVNITETQTTDFGNTSGLTFNMVVTSGNAILRTSGATGNWTVKTIVRSI
jgi:hypothetical protein